MDFLFFTAANQPLFTRNDAEQAEWTVEQFSFFGLFPFDSDKVIERGQRVAFQDADGVWQAFEIRKAKSYEPDHYQEITAEHIAVSELTDDHKAPREWTNQTAQAALSSILTGTLWSVGNVTAVGTSSGSISYGSAWQAVNTIASNWNVYITPRITIGPGGITGRYLDVAPARGNWRGLRLSINSNLEQAGVTYDDTNLLTAMYGYGKNITPEQDISANPPTPEPEDLPAEPLTFTAVNWNATEDHPAKPAGLPYLENPTAKALYGRNGRNRFGFYQNGDVSDPYILLQLTWKALKKDSEPLISIEGTLHDLKRLGYADQTIRLHDTALVEILPAGVEVQREIIQLTVDLLNPLNTTVTIGAYIPNIIYINKETAEKASGGGGGGGGGGRGQTNAEKEFSEFQTQISANQYQILLRAWQQNINNEILRQAGLSIDANGVLVYAENAEQNIGSKLKVNADAISAEATNRTNADTELSGRITTEAGKITQIVQAIGSNGEVTAASIVAAVNSAGSSVVISADHIELDGETVALSLSGQEIRCDSLTATSIGTDTLDVSIGLFTNLSAGRLSANGLTIDGADASTSINSIGPASASGGQITIPWTRLDGSAGTPINFNIAATQYYIDGVAAAYLDAVGRVAWPSASNQGTFAVSVPVEPWNAATEKGTTGSRNFALSAGAFDANHVSTVNLTMNGGSSSVIVAALPVDASGEYTAGQDSVSALIVDGNNSPVSGPQTLAGGTTLTLYPATYIGGVTERNTSAALIITTENGAASVTLANYNTGAGSQAATTDEIKFLNKTQSGNALNVTVGVRLSNGKQYSRTITDISFTPPEPPAPTVNGWDIDSTAGGGTRVWVTVNGTRYYNDFPNYP